MCFMKESWGEKSRGTVPLRELRQLKRIVYFCASRKYMEENRSKYFWREFRTMKRRNRTSEKYENKRMESRFASIRFAANVFTLQLTFLPACLKTYHGYMHALQSCLSVSLMACRHAKVHTVHAYGGLHRRMDMPGNHIGGSGSQGKRGEPWD